MIPKKEIDRVFAGTASAELSRDFLCFELPYKVASQIVPKSWTILDLGCGYAAQAYYFTSHKKYIAVDEIKSDRVIRFQTDNMELHLTSIQDFVRENIKDLDLYHTFAICSAVPDNEAQGLAIREFPHHYVWYPGGMTDIRMWID